MKRRVGKGREGREEGENFFNDLIWCKAALSLRPGPGAELAGVTKSTLPSPIPSCFFCRQLQGSAKGHLHQTASCCCPGSGKLINMSFSGTERSG